MEANNFLLSAVGLASVLASYFKVAAAVLWRAKVLEQTQFWP
jgi:hypothetical protein